MSLFTMPDGSTGADQATLDAYSGDPTQASGYTDLSTLYGVTDGSVGAAYTYATGTDTQGSSASSQTLGQLQSGGSTIDWNTIFQGGLTALIAADSINHGLTVSGQALPVYKAPNGAVYPVGTGPAYWNAAVPGAVPGQMGGGSGLMLLLLLGVVAFAIAEH